MTLWGSIVEPRQLPAPPKPVDLHVDWPEVPAGASAAAVSPSLSGGIRALYQKCHFYDVFLVCGRSRFPAHQAVLAAASPKFRDMLLQMHVRQRAGEEEAPTTERGEPQKHPELRLPGDYSAATLSALLDFIYNLGDYSAGSDEANIEVMRLATEVELPALKAHAARWLGQHLTYTNAIPMLAICEEFGLNGLSEEIKEQLTSDTQALLKVSQEVSATKHPEILQSLLMRMATQNSKKSSVTPSPEGKKDSAPSPEKREAPPPNPKKAAKQAAKRIKT